MQLVADPLSTAFPLWAKQTRAKTLRALHWKKNLLAGFVCTPLSCLGLEDLS